MSGLKRRKTEGEASANSDICAWITESDAVGLSPSVYHPTTDWVGKTWATTSQTRLLSTLLTLISTSAEVLFVDVASI